MIFHFLCWKSTLTTSYSSLFPSLWMGERWKLRWRGRQSLQSNRSCHTPRTAIERLRASNANYVDRPVAATTHHPWNAFFGDFDPMINVVRRRQKPSKRVIIKVEKFPHITDLLLLQRRVPVVQGAFQWLLPEEDLRVRKNKTMRVLTQILW